MRKRNYFEEELAKLEAAQAEWPTDHEVADAILSVPIHYANPTSLVPAEHRTFAEINFKWPVTGANNPYVYQTGQMIGKRSDGYATNFDDSAVLLFLGIHTGKSYTVNDVGFASGDHCLELKRPYTITMPLASGTASKAGDVGAKVYAVDAGHVQIGTVGLVNANLVGYCVNVIGDGSPNSLTGTLVEISPVGIILPDTSATTFTDITVNTITGGTSSTNVTGQAGSGATTGGAIPIAGGIGGTTSAGGAVSLIGGIGGTTSGSGGAASLAGGAGTAGNAVGGVASVTGGAGQGTGAGAAVNITGGASGAGATGNGGAVLIVGGAALSSNGTGGASTLRGGVGTGTGLGGAAALTGGLGGSTNAVGGAATVTAGAGQGTAAGAIAGLVGGASGSGATGNGGVSRVVGGAAASTNGNGGAAQLTGGAATGTGSGGAVTIAGGTSTSGGTAGAVTLDTGNASGGTDASITMGATNAASLILGRSTKPILFVGVAQVTVGASTAAAGSVTGDATALPSGTGNFYPTSAADDTKGVILTTADKVLGRTIMVGNGVSNKILKVYPPSGGTINGASADVAISTASGRGVTLVCTSVSGSGAWQSAN